MRFTRYQYCDSMFLFNCMIISVYLNWNHSSASSVWAVYYAMVIIRDWKRYNYYRAINNISIVQTTYLFTLTCSINVLIMPLQNGTHYTVLLAPLYSILNYYSIMYIPLFRSICATIYSCTDPLGNLCMNHHINAERLTTSSVSPVQPPESAEIFFYDLWFLFTAIVRSSVVIFDVLLSEHIVNDEIRRI